MNKHAFTFASFLAIAVAVAPLNTFAQNQDVSKLQASAQTSSAEADAGRAIDLSALPQLSAADQAIPGRFSSRRPADGLSDAEYWARKQAASQARGAVAAEAQMPKASGIGSTPGATSSFLGVNETCSFVTPSDMAVGVGGNFVVQVVNDCLGIFNKTTGVSIAGYPKSINTFFGLPPNNFGTGQFTSDPRVFYDFIAKRFVIAILYEDFLHSRGFLELAASSTANPTGAWHTYQIQVGGTGQCPDFPAMGHNHAGDKFVGDIAVGFNLFGCNTGGFTSFLDDQIWFLPKTPIYAGAGFGFNFGFNFTVGGTHVDTIQPVNVAFASDVPRAQLAVGSFNINFGGFQCRTGCNGLTVWGFSNVLQNAGSPGIVISANVIGTPSNYSLPALGSQPGGVNTIDTGDTRISGAAQYKGGSIYATLNTNNGGGGSAILAYQIHSYLNDNGDGHCTGAFLNACPTLISSAVDQEISYDIGGGTSLNAYYGTIQPDAERNLTMVFNFSGTSFFPSTAFVSNRVTQAPGSWHDSGIFLCNGAAFYNQGRWGDYTGVAIDTTSPNSMWFSGMFSRSDGNWGTCIGKNGYTASNVP